jgi:undecaprenol kinase
LISQLLKGNNFDINRNNPTDTKSSQEQASELEKYYPPTSLAKSFGHALYGIKETWLCERNFKIHTICATAAIALGLVVKLDINSWLTLILIISAVLTTEIINTALEHVVDLAANSLYHPVAKAAKDASAGAVLISSITAIVCGLIIFCPKLLALYQQIKLLSYK